MLMRADTKTAQLALYGEIGIGEPYGKTLQEFAAELKALGNVQTIQLSINSPGGNLFEAQTMAELLRKHPARVEVSIEALAASAATVVALAGDRITMAESAMFMIHNPWMLAIGDADGLRHSASVLDKLTDSFANLYAARSQSDAKRIRQLMSDETWLNAQESMDAGFVDEITRALDVRASFDPNRMQFKRVPPKLLAQMRERAPTPLSDAKRARMADYIQRAKLAA